MRRACGCCRTRFVGDRRRRAATVRRVLGYDATANFLLGFVQVCPGQPVKSSGRYSISSGGRSPVRRAWRDDAALDAACVRLLPHAICWRPPPPCGHRPASPRLRCNG
ncbi:hypothetical protein F511_25779 [Dorcoceras hygrometricum]|uniref:Uncharacterized protein n=1 Tax=Dorcoceras hygrometricum TaxID=472368 RepID=A0A2Z7ADU7_9LAMI|nr:hypothetical protein F511_25779 [Dorcoceras hygrometricum]